MSKSSVTHFRYDFVGSFLCPDALKNARRQLDLVKEIAEEVWG